MPDLKLLENLKEPVNILRGPFTAKQKANYLRYMLASKEEKLSYKPIVLSIVATGRCTLSCRMCPTHSEVIQDGYLHAQNPVKDMSFETFKKVTDSFPEAITVSIIGSGEPLLNKDFFRMVDYAAKTHKMLVKTFTNGTTLEKNIERILNSSLEGITISLNAHNAREYARLTGMKEDVFNDICSALKNLISRKNARKSPLKIKASFIIDRENYVRMNEMINLAANFGVDTIFLCNFLPSPYDGFRVKEKTLFHEDEKIRDFIGRSKEKISPLLRKKVRWPVLISKSATAFKCSSHFSQLRVDGDGNIGSCSMMLLNMSANGKIDEQDVWNNAFFRKMRRNFLTGKRDRIEKQCLACPDNLGVEV
ncbi:MAG: radical SAM protein [Omnitrophica bacterium]|nr:radical SAM protein [Candidatus Omnitrophota bacterium]